MKIRFLEHTYFQKHALVGFLYKFFVCFLLLIYIIVHQEIGVTIGNGGDAFFRLPDSTEAVNDGRLANQPTFTDLVAGQNALGLGLVQGGGLSQLTSTAGISRITVSSTQRGQYLGVPLVALSGGGGQSASAAAQMGILTPTILSPGNGLIPGTYTIPATGGGGNGAAIVVTVGAGGSITSVVLASNALGNDLIGTGYTSQPTFDLTALGGVGASIGWNAGIPFLQVASVQIQNAGVEYLTSPSVSFIIS